ncbi:hypothetical protein Vadar_021770 [Vaccinium darrowii]|uniref:Uncharacterized protein n=1 Tax=Vaccinium darrowii TaxID=229202 RepID=A0ACB7YYA4_9ERIC|nr:hypothetical protein Vadar_021770 [Vaccinium darrowii]
MAGFTIALYASPRSSICSTPHHHQINAQDSTVRSPPQKPTVGGLSCLFSSPSVKHASSSSYSSGVEDSVYRGEELSSSFRFSPYCSSLKRNQSPVSVFQGPLSCSPPLRVAREKMAADWKVPESVRGSSGLLLNGFIGHALGSCVDHDSPTFQANNSLTLQVDSDNNSSSVMVDELPFKMDDGFVESDSVLDAKELLLGAQLRHKIFHEDIVVRAFYEAERAHRGQMRESGDPYLEHCVETAVLLAVFGANSSVVAAGLLHDTLDDSSVRYDDISQTFGAEVADLVKGVSKLSHLSKLARENNTANKTAEAKRLRTMFLAMPDPKAVLIKLADRLHNMMTLDALSMLKQQRFAKETLEIFAPLAHRLGIYRWKEQLENLCFKYLYPEEHKEISSKLLNSFDEALINSSAKKLERALGDAAISYRGVSKRHKSLYSIYQKMSKKKLTLDEIHDIHGLRLIVEKEEDCFEALTVVHQLWSQVSGKFENYINRPKLNGYKSLHTVVIGEGMVPLEVQIRTRAMHLQAEFGIAAHWRYKEGDCKCSSFELQTVERARRVVSCECGTMSKDPSMIGCMDSMEPPCNFPSHLEDCPYSSTHNCGTDGPVYVIMTENEKMSVQEFPANSTILELMERASQGRWSPYRFPVKQELRPRLNGEPVSDPSCELNMGDVVELTAAMPDKSLAECREEIQRIYDRDLTVLRS